ncbi:hypothetical protein H9P43_004063 [Blastocladiella emersonii ATCC 22665]|nr:hypothetical protein H9P43_004063 [Blastocladiella emersonii ATCC 22665]
MATTAPPSTAETTALLAAEPAGALTATLDSGELAAAVVKKSAHAAQHEDVSKAVSQTREKMTSEDAAERRALRIQRAERRARVNEAANHIGVQGTVAAATLSASLIYGPIATKNPVALALRPYFRLWNRLQKEFAKTLDSANEIERRAIDLIQLADTALDIYADPKVAKIVGALQRGEILKLIRKIESKIAEATEVLERLDQSSDTRMMLIGNQKVKIELGQINATITSAQAQLHAHITTSMMALLDHQGERNRKLNESLAVENAMLKEQGGRIDEMYKLGLAFRAHDEKMDKQLALLLAQVQAVDNRAGFWADLKSPEVSLLWDAVVGPHGDMACPAGQFLLTLEEHVERLRGDRFDPIDGWIRFVNRKDAVVTLADLGYTTEVSANLVSVHALDALFPEDPNAKTKLRLNVLLGWRAYAWAVHANDCIDRIAAIAAQSAVCRSTALVTRNLARRAIDGLKASAVWDITPKLEARLRGLRLKLSPAIADALPPKYAALVRALDAVEKTLAECYTTTEAAGWLDDDAAAKLAADFPARISKLQDAVVAAAVALGLPADVAQDAAWTPRNVESCTAKAQAAIETQLAHFDELAGALEARPDDIMAALAGLAWADVGAAATRASPWGNAVLFKYDPVAIIRCPAEVAPAAIANLAGLRARGSAHLLRVYGVLPPTPATGGDWAVVVERFDPHVVFDKLDLQSKLAAAEDVVRAAQVIHGAQVDLSGDVVAQPFDASHVVFTRNVLGQVATKLVPPGLVVTVNSVPLAGLATLGTEAAAKANVDALVKFIQRAILDVHPAPARPAGYDYAGPAHDGAPGHPGDLFRALRRHIEQHTAGRAPAPTFGELVEDLQLAQSKYREALEAEPGSALVGGSAGTVSDDASVIAFEALAFNTPASPTAASRLGTMSADEAMRKYFAARATIRDSRHRPATRPDYDVHDVYQKLVEAGQSGHQPMAYVAAADLFYYGTVPRTPDSWRVAMRLYRLAIEQGALYAHAGIGDLLLFHLVEDPTTARSRDEILTAAAEQYELAQLALTDPGTRALLAPHEIARVDCGLGDVLFERAQLAADAGDAHLAEDLRRRARAHYHEAKDEDPRAKRAFARLALFALHGFGGEARSLRNANMFLASARSADNPARELAARAQVLAVIDDGESLAACRAEMDACTTPDH